MIKMENIELLKIFRKNISPKKLKFDYMKISQILWFSLADISQCLSVDP